MFMTAIFYEKGEVFYVAKNDNIISEQCIFFTENHNPERINFM